MSNTPAPNIYESTFASSDKTDAILVVDGKKLHVNKALLSCHSDYFKALFNSEFAEKSIPEIPIDDVKLEDINTLLSNFKEKPPRPPGIQHLLKMDAILVIKGKKILVDKSLLSRYSDYFKAVFDKFYSIQSMPEIPIKDVKYEEFATLVSLIQNNPISPTEANTEKLLELADRFQMPSAKRHVELFICSTKINRNEKLRLADKYNLETLLENTVELMEKPEDFKDLYKLTLNFSDHTRSKLFQRFFYLCQSPSYFELVKKMMWRK